MSEEMKLLRALCKALGYEVEVTLNYHPRKENYYDAMRHNDPSIPTDRVLKSEEASGKLLIDDEGMCTSLLRKPETSYEVVK